MISSNVAFWNSTLTPSTSPMALPRSTSMPWIVVLSSAKNSFGAYDESVATTILPADLIFSGSLAARASSTPDDAAVVLDPPLLASVFEESLLLLPHAAANSMRARTTAVSLAGVVRMKASQGAVRGAPDGPSEGIGEL